MSLRRSERLATAASKPTDEAIQPTGTQRSTQTRSSRARSTKSSGVTTQRSRLRVGVMRPHVKPRDTDDADQEDEAGEGSPDDVTDPAKVKQPILHLIDPALVAAWDINTDHEMCFIFDAISPARRFKRGMVFNEDADFPQDTCDGDITETDGPDPGWMPVNPRVVGCVCKHSTHHTDKLIPCGMQDEIQFQMQNHTPHTLGVHGLEQDPHLDNRIWTCQEGQESIHFRDQPQGPPQPI